MPTELVTQEFIVCFSGATARSMCSSGQPARSRRTSFYRERSFSATSLAACVVTQRNVLCCLEFRLRAPKRTWRGNTRRTRVTRLGAPLYSGYLAVALAKPMTELGFYGFLEAVADAIKCLDHVERVIDRLELLA